MISHSSINFEEEIKWFIVAQSILHINIKIILLLNYISYPSSSKIEDINSENKTQYFSFMISFVGLDLTLICVCFFFFSSVPQWTSVKYCV